jgi:hypothetical protein
MTTVIAIIIILIIITSIREKSSLRRNPTIDHGRLMCWKFGLLGVTAVPLLSSELYA